MNCTFVTTPLIFPQAHTHPYKVSVGRLCLQHVPDYYGIDKCVCACLFMCVTTEKKATKCLYLAIVYGPGPGRNFCFRWHPLVRLGARRIIPSNMPLNSTKDCRTDYVREHLFGSFICVVTLFFCLYLMGGRGRCVCVCVWITFSNHSYSFSWPYFMICFDVWCPNKESTSLIYIHFYFTSWMCVFVRSCACPLRMHTQSTNRAFQWKCSCMALKLFC